MASNLLLIDHTCDLTTLPPHGSKHYDAIVCLFWASPETRTDLSQKFGGDCYDLHDITGDSSNRSSEAISLAQKICSTGPQLDGLPWRGVLSEQVYHLAWEFLTIQSAVEFVYILPNSKPIRIDCILIHSNEQALRLLLSHHTITITSLTGSTSFSRENSSLAARIFRRIQETAVTGNWRAQAAALVDEADRDYRFRRACQYLPQRPVPANALTFFSSYLNNSQILQSYESLMPGQVHWVVTNHYARRGTANARGSVNWLWDYFPRQSHHLQANDSAPLLAEEAWMHWFEQRPAWQNWQSKILPLLRQQTRCWLTYLDRAKPRLVVMANQWGIEGWFTALAQKAGIPVLHIMHGVFGGELYTGTPLPADGMVLWGDHWRRLLQASEGKPVIVHAPPGRFYHPRPERPGKPVITCFSWPLDRMAFYNGSELLQIFVRMLHSLHSHHEANIIVRFHPLENPHDFTACWESQFGAIPPGVILSKHEPLEDVIRQTDIALMYRSTVMLDCLTAGIPVIMPGWLDPGWKNGLPEMKGLAFATGEQDMADIITTWLQHPPNTMPDEIRALACHPDECQSSSLVDFLQSLWQH